jgi:hypothetical protein
VFLVVLDAPEADAGGTGELVLQTPDQVMIDWHFAQGRGVGLVARGEDLARVGLMQRGNNGYDLRPEVPERLEGVGGDQAGVDVTGVWRDDAKHLACGRDDLGLAELFVDGAGERVCVAGIPGPSDGGGPDIGSHLFISLAIRL